MSFTPYHLRQPQDWAVAQVRQHHDEALYLYGEYSMFVLLWNIDDLEGGLVDRCPTCYIAYGDLADVYQQPARRKCEDCFGTTFEGGFKAKIVRPSLWDFGEQTDEEGRRGEEERQVASIQSTEDFRMRNNDWVIRADNSRWQIQTVSGNNLRTGFEHPSRPRSAIAYNYGQVQREDESSVSYLVPPTDAAEVTAILDIPWVTSPTDFAAYETIRGPLL